MGARTQEMPELRIGFSDPLYITYAARPHPYEVDDPAGMIGVAGNA